MLGRHVTEAVVVSRKGFPAVLILGPRQSGKTMLVRAACSDLAYVNFESPLERAELLSDPLGFFARYPDGCILDEVQNVPELVSYLLVRIDADRRMGRWVLNGSQQLELRGKVQQSLAGRVAQFELLPLSMAELVGAAKAPRTLHEAILHGGYPALYDESRTIERPATWHEDYIASFVNRDIRSILDLREGRAFDLFIKKCAGLTGQQVNKNQLGQLCSVDGKTIDAWIHALEVGFLVRVVRPYHRNFGKRLAKQPRLYFLDSGVACRLLGITSIQQLETHPLEGALVETWCYGELLKFFANRQSLETMHSWRTSDGHGVDFVIEIGNRLIPIEVTASSAPSSSLASGISKLATVAAGDSLEVAKGIVVYAGDEIIERSAATFVPWFRVAEVLEQRL